MNMTLRPGRQKDSFQNELQNAMKSRQSRGLAADLTDDNYDDDDDDGVSEDELDFLSEFQLKGKDGSKGKSHPSTVDQWQPPIFGSKSSERSKSPQDLPGRKANKSPASSLDRKSPADPFARKSPANTKSAADPFARKSPANTSGRESPTTPRNQKSPADPFGKHSSSTDPFGRKSPSGSSAGTKSPAPFGSSDRKTPTFDMFKKKTAVDNDTKSTKEPPVDPFGRKSPSSSLGDKSKIEPGSRKQPAQPMASGSKSSIPSSRKSSTASVLTESPSQSTSSTPVPSARGKGLFGSSTSISGHQPSPQNVQQAVSEQAAADFQAKQNMIFGKKSPVSGLAGKSPRGSTSELDRLQAKANGDSQARGKPKWQPPQLSKSASQQKMDTKNLNSGSPSPALDRMSPSPMSQHSAPGRESLFSNGNVQAGGQPGDSLLGHPSRDSFQRRTPTNEEMFENPLDPTAGYRTRDRSSVASQLTERDKFQGEEEVSIRPRARRRVKMEDDGESSVCMDVEREPRVEVKREDAFKTKEDGKSPKTPGARELASIDKVAGAQGLEPIAPDYGTKRSKSAPVKPKPRLGTDPPVEELSFESAEDIRQYIYTQWKQEKDKRTKLQRAEAKRKQKEDEEQKEKDKLDREIEKKATFNAWAEKKKGTIHTIKRTKAEEEKKKKEEELAKLNDKKDAAKAFSRWKENKDEKIVKTMRKQCKAEAAKLEEEKRLKEQKAKEKDNAYESWRRVKTSKIKEEQKKKKVEEKEKRMTKREMEETKEKESEELYEMWLERKEKQKQTERRRQLVRTQYDMENPQPAWSPANVMIPHHRS